VQISDRPISISESWAGSAAVGSIFLLSPFVVACQSCHETIGFRGGGGGGKNLFLLNRAALRVLGRV